MFRRILKDRFFEQEKYDEDFETKPVDWRGDIDVRIETKEFPRISYYFIEETEEGHYTIYRATRREQSPIRVMISVDEVITFDELVSAVQLSLEVKTPKRLMRIRDERPDYFETGFKGYINKMEIGKGFAYPFDFYFFYGVIE